MQQFFNIFLGCKLFSYEVLNLGVHLLQFWKIYFYIIKANLISTFYLSISLNMFFRINIAGTTYISYKWKLDIKLLKDWDLEDLLWSANIATNTKFELFQLKNCFFTLTSLRKTRKTISSFIILVFTIINLEMML